MPLDNEHCIYSVLVGYSPELWDVLVRREYAALRQAHGLPPDPHYRQYFRYMCLRYVPERITPLPRSIADRSQLTRPELPAEASVDLPAWSDHLADLPTVYVTLATVYNQTRGLIETILAALGQGSSISSSPSVPSAIRRNSARSRQLFISRDMCHKQRFCQSVLLWCAWGSGTLLGALAQGLPMRLLH